VATHAVVATANCPSLKGKQLHPHVLRHSCAMSLLQAGVDTTVIALWLGHADVRSTQAYLHADLTIKEKALALVTPAATSRRTPSSRSSKACDYADKPTSAKTPMPHRLWTFTTGARSISA